MKKIFAKIKEMINAKKDFNDTIERLESQGYWVYVL